DIRELKDQDTVILDESYIISMFKEPIPINDPDKGMGSILSDELLYSDEYVYWDRNKKLNMLILFQKKQDRPVYYNENGIVFIFLNEDNEAIFYTQTVLDQTETNGDKYTLIEPIIAIEKLYNSNELTTGDDITNIDLGFHTRIPPKGGVQVFSPTWRVTVNGEKNYFVNAIEGLVSSS